MGFIRHLPYFSRYQGTPTAYVIHLRAGKIRHSGTGLAFWFNHGRSVLAEVPTIDQERGAVFHGHTSDQQDIAVQAAITYRFADPIRVTHRFDFDLYPAPRTGPRLAGREQVADLIGKLTQAAISEATTTLTLQEALRVGLATIRTTLTRELVDHPRLTDSGIAVCDVRILSLRPAPEVEKALQTPLREQLQAEADRALYERRAIAVEREQRILENELASKLELARRHEELVRQEGTNDRRQAEERAAAALITAQAEAERTELHQRSQAAGIRTVGAAEVDIERTRYAAYAEAGPAILHALALKEAATHLPQIGELTITSDMLTRTLSTLLTHASPKEAQ